MPDCSGRFDYLYLEGDTIWVEVSLAKPFSNALQLINLSSWYHSHYSLQAWEGVAGGIVIHGPASGNYDEDLGIMMLSDWDHETADSLYAYAETQGQCPHLLPSTHF